MSAQTAPPEVPAASNGVAPPLKVGDPVRFLASHPTHANRYGVIQGANAKLGFLVRPSDDRTGLGELWVPGRDLELCQSVPVERIETPYIRRGRSTDDCIHAAGDLIGNITYASLCGGDSIQALPEDNSEEVDCGVCLSLLKWPRKAASNGLAGAPAPQFQPGDRVAIKPGHGTAFTSAVVVGTLPDGRVECHTHPDTLIRVLPTSLELESAARPVSTSPYFGTCPVCGSGPGVPCRGNAGPCYMRIVTSRAGAAPEPDAPDPLSVACPLCYADTGEHCMMDGSFHYLRILESRGIHQALPEKDPGSLTSSSAAPEPAGMDGIEVLAAKIEQLSDCLREECLRELERHLRPTLALFEAGGMQELNFCRVGEEDSLKVALYQKARSVHALITSATGLVEVSFAQDGEVILYQGADCLLSLVRDINRIVGESQPFPGAEVGQ